MRTEAERPFRAARLLRTEDEQAMVEESWQVVCETTALFIFDDHHQVHVPEDPTDTYLRLQSESGD